MRRVLFVILILLIVVGGALYLRFQSLPAIIAEELVVNGMNKRYFSCSFYFEPFLEKALVKQTVVYSGFISFDKQISQEESQEIIRILYATSNYERELAQSELSSLIGDRTLIFQNDQQQVVGYAVVKKNWDVGIISKDKVGIFTLKHSAYPKLLEIIR